MPPNEKIKLRDKDITGVLFEVDADTVDGDLIKQSNEPVNIAEKREYKLVWVNIITIVLQHIGALYGAKLYFTSVTWQTRVFFTGLYLINVLGVTAGAHRLWAHRSYKATWQFRLFLMLANTLAVQGPILTWARDHRVHHKYSETDADPHNAARGMFFAHIGWLLCKKHPQVVAKGKCIDVSDLRDDPIVMFQKRNYLWLILLVCFALPTVIPAFFWNESVKNAFFVCAIMRWCMTLNITFCVNSIGHSYGNRTYDKSINPVDNTVIKLITFGDGWHNFHHVFPWDYRSAELGGLPFNYTAFVINCFAKIGWVYDRKTVTKELIERRMNRTGDGSKVW